MTTPALGDVLLGAAAGPEPLNDGARLAAARLALPQVRTWCVVLVDGLGWHNLTARAEHAPFLHARIADQHGPGAPVQHVQATIPTSTATNLAFLGTAQQGGRTGMLGYTVRNPATGGLVNLISWKGGADPVQWQQQPTVFEQMAGAGRSAASVGPWEFADSGLTAAALRGAEYYPAQSLTDRVETALGLLRDPGVDLVYLYWGELDAVGHARGWRSAQWGQELRDLDDAVQHLARRLPVGTGFILTADHGMIDIPHTDLSGMAGRIDAATHPELCREVDLLAGEPRFVHVYTRAPAAVAERWRQVLGERATVQSRTAAIAAGMFGHVLPEYRDLVGDVVVATHGQVAIQDSRQQSPAALNLVGMHGSTSAAETQVPLVVVAD